MSTVEQFPHAANVAPTRNLSRPVLRVCGALTLCIGVLGLIGWFGNVPALKTVLPGLPAMKPNCALGLAAAAVALIAASRFEDPRYRFIAWVLSLVVGLIGVATVMQLGLGIDVGIDDLAALSSAGDRPGRLSLVTALGLILLALAAPCVTFPRPWTRLIVWALSLLGLLIAFFGIFFTLLGIFYDPQSLYATSAVANIALHAGLGFLILFSGLLLWGCRDSLRLPLVSLAILVLAPLAAIMIYFALAERRAALEAGRERVANRAHLLAVDTNAVIEDAHNVLRLIADTRAGVRGRAGVTDSTSPGPGCAVVLGGLQRLHSWITLLRISRLDGTLICASPATAPGIAITDRSYFKDAVEKRAFSVSGLLISRVSQQARLFAALPLIENGEVVAVVSLAIDLAVFNDIINRVGLEPGEVAVIVSTGGLVFANSPHPPDLVGSNLGAIPIVQRALSEGSGQSTEPDWNGRDRLFAFRPITDTGAVVLVGLGKRTVTHEIDRTLRDRVGLLVLLMAATALASLVGGELLVFRPIRRLAQRAALIERGDFGGRSYVSGVGEIWTLHSAFIRMRDAIADRERQLNEAMARHRAVFESAIDAIITMNESGSIESLNPAAEQLFGYKQDVLLHRHIMVLLPGDPGRDAPGTVRDLRQALLGLGKVREIEARRADGSTFPADVALSDMQIGVRRMMVAIVRDATERKRMDRMKDEFVSTVSHELRTPLTSIAGSLGLLAGGAAGQLSDATQRLIAIAHRNSQRLIRLINDILDLEKIEAGKLVFVLAPVALRDLAVEAIDANQAFAQTHGVSITLVPGNEAGQVIGDRDRLMQVLTNLLSNAIKFSPRGGQVQIGVTRREQQVRLTVSDQGPGIPIEFRNRIFTRFAQADSSDARNKGGTGLGLAVAKEIVDRHDGTLSFDTELGRGTSFHVDLPAEELAAVPVTDPGTAEILVVEDDHDTAVVLRDMLARSGFSTIIAATAKDGEHLAANPATKVILVDLGLPDRDGISLIRALRADPKTRRIPIIVITARKHDAAGAAEAHALAVLDWIEKPVDLARLREALETAVGPADSLRILHVEDDPDVRHLVAQALAHAGTIHSVATLAEARAAIAGAEFDIVILDMSLPDGSGSDLLPALTSPAGDPIPVVIFSARETDPEIARRVQAVLTKSQSSLDYLVRIVARLCRPDDVPAERRAGTGS
jgi:PAS domain S-box-containing protein